VSEHWFAVALRTGARRVVASPGAYAMPAFIYVLVVLAIGGMWRAAAGANGGAIAGYSAVAITWYIAASEAAYVSVDTKMIEQIGDEIASGEVAMELLRPASVFGVRIASQLGRVLPKLLMLSATGCVLCLLLVGRPPDPLGLALAAPALVLAVSCNLAAQHAVAAISFWIRDAKSGWFLYQKVIFIIGGMLLPLQALPDRLHDIALALPFMTMAYVPARLASGHIEPELLLVQLAWLTVLMVVAAVVFSAGERRLQVVGG
jgi:ABC-2 type transport system permease protein